MKTSWSNTIKKYDSFSMLTVSFIRYYLTIFIVNILIECKDGLISMVWNAIIFSVSIINYQSTIITSFLFPPNPAQLHLAINPKLSKYRLLHNISIVFFFSFLKRRKNIGNNLPYLSEECRNVSIKTIYSMVFLQSYGEEGGGRYNYIWTPWQK